MGRTTTRGVLVITALLAVGVALAACGTSDQSTGGGGSAAAFTTGQSVAAKWTDGDFYLATVTAVDGEKVTVKYADDGSSRTVPATEARAFPNKAFAVGDRVLAVYSAGHLYPGAVTKVDGTAYTVKWDDGSLPSNVEAGKIIAQ